MEVKVIQEDLSKFDLGGGYKEAEVTIHVDNTMPLIRQRHAVAYEILSAYLDPNEHKGNFLDELAQAIIEGIDQLE